MKPRRAASLGQTMAEYALLLASVALIGYGMTAFVGYNFLDDAIDALIGHVVSLF